MHLYLSSFSNELFYFSLQHWHIRTSKVCPLYISRCESIHRYLVYIERRNIRQVMLNSAIQHFSEFADSEDTNIMISTKSLSLKPLKVATDVSCMHLIWFRRFHRDDRKLELVISILEDTNWSVHMRIESTTLNSNFTTWCSYPYAFWGKNLHKKSYARIEGVAICLA